MMKIFKRNKIKVGEKESCRLEFDQWSVMKKCSLKLYKEGANEFSVSLMLKMDYDATNDEIKEILDYIIKKGGEEENEEDSI